MRTDLTPKQQAFVREYLIDLNASAAARRAGYSPKTAGRTGNENLQKPVIATAIQKAMSERAQRTNITADRVLHELSLLAFSNMLDYLRVTPDGDAYVDLSDLTREQAAALTEVQVEDFVEGRGEDSRDVRRVKVKVSDKKSALELLGKHLSLFTDRVDVTSRGEAVGAVSINVIMPDNGREPEQLEEGGE